MIPGIVAGARSGAVSPFDKLVSTNLFPTGTFNINSSSYQNVLNQNGGSPMQVTITKGAGTSLLVLASMSIGDNSASVVTLGVNDGTTDYDLARIRTDGSAFNLARTAVGSRLISGLPAGSYTMTLRVKSPTATAFFAGTEAASLSVMEVA